MVEEPSVEETVRILKGLKSRYEEHHQVEYTDDALEAATRLASRHLRDYRLPDSAIDVLDEAGARRRVGPQAKAEERESVDVVAVEQVVARMARIPEKQASASDTERLRTLEESLERVVFAQQEAVRGVSRAIKRARAGLGIPERPSGCFLFTGPTGVGKTELAKQLARHLGNEFLRFDMSEYMEKHAVARLIGAPPGYVGFEQGGLLVDAVRNNPYSVVLLDEIEKAHPDIYNVLLQVMDHATLTDNSGRKADFRQVILIMTSNAGSREMSASLIGLGRDRSRDTEARGRSAIERVFSPEFRNRLDAIVTFKSLTPEAMETIVEKLDPGARGAAARAAGGDHAAPRGARLPGTQGLRPRPRRAAAGTRDPGGDPRPADRRGAVRQAPRRRQRDDRARGGDAELRGRRRRHRLGPGLRRRARRFLVSLSARRARPPRRPRVSFCGAVSAGRVVRCPPPLDERSARAVSAAPLRTAAHRPPRRRSGFRRRLPGESSG